MYEGEAPTPAFTPKEHIVEVRPEVQQAAAVASPQATYPRAEKHGTGNVFSRNVSKKVLLLSSAMFLL